jgi:DNA-binding HxlR family transcriptional regulator
MKLENITETPVSRRSYDDACGAAHALDLVGERWALLVMRELLLGPRRFGDLKADLPGISANVLTQRLEGLEAAGILQRRRLPPPAKVQVYELTEWGYESEPIFEVLGRWAARSPLHDPTLPLSAVSLFLSFRTMFDPARAGAASATIAFVFGEEGFRATVADGGIAVERRDLGDAASAAAGADVVVEGSPRGVAAVVYGGRPLAAVEAAGLLSLTGNRAVFERFTGWFPLPPKAASRR